MLSSDLKQNASIIIMDSKGELTRPIRKLSLGERLIVLDPKQPFGINYAAELDIRVKAGELERWERQVPIELRINDHKICTYTIDFVEYDTRGNIMYTEIKGFETPEWRLKWKLFDALHPEWEKEVIKLSGMNDDEELNTFLLDNDPAKLLSHSKQLLPEDPEAVLLPRAHHQSRMFDDDNGTRHANG
jgi:hypothetical protein